MILWLIVFGGCVASAVAVSLLIYSFRVVKHAYDERKELDEILASAGYVDGPDDYLDF